METLKVKNPADSVAWTLEGFLLGSAEDTMPIRLRRISAPAGGCSQAKNAT